MTGTVKGSTKRFSGSDHGPMLVAAILGALLIAGCIVAAGIGGKVNPGLWFIVLMVIALAALAMAATVFSGLKLASAKEAFGLPSGSVRALLALGIMVLLVVFGLQYLVGGSNASPPHLADQPLATVSLPVAKVPGAVALYRQEHFTVVMVNPGEAASPGPPPVAEVPAQLALYPLTTARTQAETDLTKTLLTAILGLLSTVIGFYFGARSATDGMKAAQAGGGATGGADLVAQRKQAGDAFAAANQAAAAAEAELKTLIARDPLANGVDQATRLKLQEVASAAAAEVDTDRGQIQTSLDSADVALKALVAGAAPADQSAHQAQAAAALKAAEGQLDDFKTKSDALVKATSDVAAAVNARG
jgi:hypothetical protein